MTYGHHHRTWPVRPWPIRRMACRNRRSARLVAGWWSACGPRWPGHCALRPCAWARSLSCLYASGLGGPLNFRQIMGW